MQRKDVAVGNGQDFNSICSIVFCLKFFAVFHELSKVLLLAHNLCLLSILGKLSSSTSESQSHCGTLSPTSTHLFVQSLPPGSPSLTSPNKHIFSCKTQFMIQLFPDPSQQSPLYVPSEHRIYSITTFFFCIFPKKIYVCIIIKLMLLKYKQKKKLRTKKAMTLHLQKHLQYLDKHLTGQLLIFPQTRMQSHIFM